MHVLMTDYYGVCDHNGKVMGHTVKVLNEYSSMLLSDEGNKDKSSNAIKVSAALSPCILKEINTDEELHKRFEELICLPEDIHETEGYGVRKRIADKFRLFRNLRHVFRIGSSYDVIWFYRTDFFLFLYMMLHRKPKKCRIACLVYQQSFSVGKMEDILQLIYHKGLEKVDGLICSNANHIETMKAVMAKSNPEASVFFMPDFSYDPLVYSPYRHAHKRKEGTASAAAFKDNDCSSLSRQPEGGEKYTTVCMGTMNPYKQLEELVEVYLKNGQYLEICGRFFDHNRAVKLQRMAADGGGRIHIEDANLSEEDYLGKIGRADFAVLPYDMHQYQNRTSGVLQECAFLGTIPIAPKQLLEENHFPGAGYEDIGELAYPDYFDQIEITEIRQKLDTICGLYNRKKITAELSGFFIRLANGRQ